MRELVGGTKMAKGSWYCRVSCSSGETLLQVR